ncbi:hypothetical protein Ahy_A04g019864 [Arachis hypogaea]|uniref:Uncharacterized protein n=1 Tax=Arachis hypogaea TaxID=3818 RepID=A0A445DGN8_ARAHY|nr:hypothetical protein Ahy_A04g019864 [Arachis hypogaea]
MKRSAFWAFSTFGPDLCFGARINSAPTWIRYFCLSQIQVLMKSDRCQEVESSRRVSQLQESDEPDTPSLTKSDSGTSSQNKPVNPLPPPPPSLVPIPPIPPFLEPNFKRRKTSESSGPNIYDVGFDGAEVASLREAEKGLEEEKIRLEAELFKTREKEKQSSASCAPVEGLLKKTEENYELLLLMRQYRVLLSQKSSQPSRTFQLPPPNPIPLQMKIKILLLALFRSLVKAQLFQIKLVYGCSGYSSAVKLEIEKFDGRINFGLWQVQVKDVLIQSGLHKVLKEKIFGCSLYERR